MNKELEKIERYIELDPKNIKLWIDRSIILSKLNRPQMAKHSYNRGCWLVGYKLCKECNRIRSAINGQIDHDQKDGWVLTKCKDCIGD